MAVPFIVDAPIVTWPSSPIDSGSETCLWQTATINQTGGTSSYLTQANLNASVPLLRSWAGTFSGHLGSPVNGAGLGITYGTGYATSVESFSVNITVDPKGYYSSSGTGSWQSFIPSTIKWSGSYTALVDEDLPIIAVGADAAPASLTFTLSSGNTLAGTVLSSSVSNVMPVGDLSRVTVNVEGSGGLTAVGSNNILAAAAPITAQAASALSITARESGATDVTYSGNAFWTSLGLTVADNANIGFNVGFQGTGALTIATPTP